MKVAVEEYVKPIKGQQLSPLWEHFDLVRKVCKDLTEFMSMCKVCGSISKNNNLSSSVCGQHVERKATTGDAENSYAHKIIQMHCKAVEQLNAKGGGRGVALGHLYAGGQFATIRRIRAARRHVNQAAAPARDTVGGTRDE